LLFKLKQVLSWHYRCCIFVNLFYEKHDANFFKCPCRQWQWGCFRAAQPINEVAQIMGALYGDGFLGKKDAFPREWVQQLHEDVLRLYEEALRRPGGAVGRGPKRHYVEIHPEDIRGFIDLAYPSLGAGR
jgi:hypothetical protein